MKIAVHGDSFATSRKPLETSWFNLLGKKLNCEVDTYGVPAASLYTSYKKILETHESYDMIILLVTEPARFPVEVKLTETSFHVSGINTLEWIVNRNTDFDAVDKSILNDVAGWFRASDTTYINDVRDLMLEKIESLGKPVILFPCFNDSMPKEKLKEGNIPVCLFDIVIKQLSLLGIKQPSHDLFMSENADVISAHLSPEFNDFFAEVVYNRILTGKWDLSQYSTVQLLHDRDYYYE